MATEIPEPDLERLIKDSTVVDTYESSNSEDSDDYVIASLYRTTDGRHFRYVESSGMDSVHVGAGNFGHWLTEVEVARWTEV